MKLHDGCPKVATEGSCLGVRVPDDIRPDNEGFVIPCGDGLSVNRSISDLPFMYVPKKYKAIAVGAKGNNSSSIWRHGDGPFENSKIDDRLSLHCATPVKGLVQPRTKMQIADFQLALAGTRQNWSEVPYGDQ